MKYKINWQNIKNGYKGFESLAVKYVQQEYDSGFFHTHSTRDGNKDAILEKEVYTIILGYQPSVNSVEEWWMEAKYSESKDIIPRYRLDATLVSAILKGNVGRIFFVTNTNIQNQVINDIRQAIIGVTVCKEVNFCTRNTLEYWLYQNTDILKEFFPDYHNEPIEIDELILVDKIKYFTASQINYVFKESLQVLDLDQVYRADFTIFSNDDQILSLRIDQRLRGIKLITPHKVILKKGINNVQFSFLLKKNYGYKSNKRNQEHILLPEPAFQLGTLQVVSADSVVVNKQTFINYEIPSQKKVQREILNFFTKAARTTGTSLFYLYGQSGVGKSFVINNYINAINSNCSCFYCEMSGDYQQDLKNIIDCINYIYFPFIPSSTITVEYLKQIETDNYIPNSYQDMISLRNDEEQLSRILIKYISENISLFPKRLYINQRQIIIDNIHKANNIITNVLYKIVIEQSMINAPFRFIFCGQWIQHTEIYTQLYTTVNIKEKELYITVDDCLGLFPNSILGDKLKVFLQSNLLFSNMLELLMFSLYLKENNRNVNDFETFQIIYRLFFLENIMDIYLKRLFNNVLSNDIEASNLCNQVYWNPYGIPRTDTEIESRLLCSHLVKLDATAQRIIPYHDLYTSCYRKNYVCTQLLDIPLVQLLEAGNYSNIKSITNKLHEEYKKKNYILVYYTLEPLFREGSIYRNLMDDTTYFTLFQDFAHSCTFCSIDYSGGKLFERIYNETKLLYNPSQQIRLIHNAALWELSNSVFESLDYNRALILCDELLDDTKALVDYGITKGTPENSIRYHNINVIKSMIKSEMQEEDDYAFFKQSEQKMLLYNMENRLWSFRVRYSLTLMQKDFRKALCLLQECQKHYEMMNKNTEKYYLWSSFYISYIKMITDKDSSTRHHEETKALTILEQIKDLYFNDYRKMLYGMILYFYYCNRKDVAELYLLKDCYVLREKRPRLKGFEHLIFALRYIMENDNLTALRELKSAYIIFKHIPSYSNIIEHNINLIETERQITNEQIKYYLNGEIQQDIYYLDIRGCW